MLTGRKPNESSNLIAKKNVRRPFGLLFSRNKGNMQYQMAA